jgi:hypothetical protein
MDGDCNLGNVVAHRGDLDGGAIDHHRAALR